MIPTVLLVDDDLSVLQALVRSMRKEPFTFRTATSAAEALKILEANDVDAVVSDWGMPGMSGTEFMSQAARLYPETTRIMLTGQSNLQVAMGAINNGRVHRFLTKPFDAAALAATIREVLDERASSSLAGASGH